MDEAGGGSRSPAVGPGRGEGKNNYPRSQAEVKDDVDY
jgi:hypothetical protein